MRYSTSIKNMVFLFVFTILTAVSCVDGDDSVESVKLATLKSTIFLTTSACGATRSRLGRPEVVGGSAFVCANLPAGK